MFISFSFTYFVNKLKAAYEYLNIFKIKFKMNIWILILNSSLKWMNCGGQKNILKLILAYMYHWFLKYGVLFLFNIAKVFLDSFNHFTLEVGRKENLK